MLHTTSLKTGGRIPGPAITLGANRDAMFGIGTAILIEAVPPSVSAAVASGAYVGFRIAVNLVDGTLFVPVNGRGAPLVSFGGGIYALRFGFGGDRTPARNGSLKNDSGLVFFNSATGSLTIAAVAKVYTPAVATGSGGAFAGSFDGLTFLRVNSATGALEFSINGTIVASASGDYRDNTTRRYRGVLDAGGNKAAVYVDNAAVAVATNVTARVPFTTGGLSGIVGGAGFDGNGIVTNPFVGDLFALAIVPDRPTTDPAFAVSTAVLQAWSDGCAGLITPDLDPAAAAAATYL